jgi:hypothetical protein
MVYDKLILYWKKFRITVWFTWVNRIPIDNELYLEKDEVNKRGRKSRFSCKISENVYIFLINQAFMNVNTTK